ncbi:MAG: 30S ribosomal protein S20 [Gammaproteobacteria bacterium]|nr:30S ribosomal protein S20 [Gammaproteobacteria bacterium]
MANSKQAEKRSRQAEKCRLHNASISSEMRTSVKKVEKNIDQGDKEAAQTAYRLAVPKLDRAADKGMIHKNKAARHKSRLNTRIRAMQ